MAYNEQSKNKVISGGSRPSDKGEGCSHPDPEISGGGGGPSLRASVWSSPGSATGKDQYFLTLKHFPFVLKLMVSFIRYLWIHFFFSCTRFAPRSLVTSLGVGVMSASKSKGS